MRSKVERHSGEAEKTVRDIRRATRRQYSAEEKVRIVIAGLRGEDSVSELCRKEGINQNLYYRWSKDFLEAGKKRLAGDTAREATSDEVKGLRAETPQLKERRDGQPSSRSTPLRPDRCPVGHFYFGDLPSKVDQHSIGVDSDGAGSLRRNLKSS
jgi:transposase